MAALPTAFDTSIGSNFTQSTCPDFFNSFLNNQQFVDCYPMSFYLKNSQSYVKAVRSGMDAVETILNASCSVDYASCSSLMSQLGQQLIQQGNCHNDFQLENPLVTQAYTDFLHYDLIYDATCLTLQEVGETYHAVSASLGSTASLITTTSRRAASATSSTSAPATTSTSGSSSSLSPAHYCYTDALFNYTDSADAYLYLLPLGNFFPDADTVIPSCSPCTNRIMSLYHEATAQGNLSMSALYTSASSVISQHCGAAFVNTSALTALADTAASASTSTSSNAASSAVPRPPSSVQLLATVLPVLLLLSLSSH